MNLQILGYIAIGFAIPIVMVIIGFFVCICWGECDESVERVRNG